MRTAGVRFAASGGRSALVPAIEAIVRTRPAAARVSLTDCDNGDAGDAGDPRPAIVITERLGLVGGSVTLVTCSDGPGAQAGVTLVTISNGWRRPKTAARPEAGAGQPVIVGQLVAGLQQSGIVVGPVEELRSADVARIAGNGGTWRAAGSTVVGTCVAIALVAIAAVVYAVDKLVENSTGSAAESMRQLGLGTRIDVARASAFFVPLGVLAAAAAAAAVVARRSALAPRASGSAAGRAVSGTVAILTAGAGLGIALSAFAVGRMVLAGPAGALGAWAAGCATVAVGAFLAWSGLAAVRMPAFRPPTGAVTLGILCAAILVGVPVAAGAPSSPHVGTAWAWEGFVAYGRASVPRGTIPVTPVSVACVGTSWCLATGFERVGMGTMTSVDGGMTWSVAGSSETIGAAGDVRCWGEGTCLGVSGVPVRTLDGGRTWQAMAVPTGGWGLSAVACIADGPCLVGGQHSRSAPEAAGSGAIFRTADGGSTFQDTRVPSGTWQVHGMACGGPRLCVAVGSVTGAPRSPGFILASMDGGSRWQSEPVPTDTPDLSGVACGDPSHCIAVGVMPSTGSQVSVAVTTSDGGATWARHVLPVPDVSGVRVACFSSADCIVLEQGARRLFAIDTTDGGTTWEPSPLHAPDQTSLGPYGPFALDLACTGARNCVVVGGRATAGGMRAYIAYTADGGRAWGEGRLAHPSRP